MRRALILVGAIGSACSTEPSFETGSAASSGSTGSGVSSSASIATVAQAISASAAGGGDPGAGGGDGASGGGSPGHGGAGGEGTGASGVGGGGGDGGDGGGTSDCGDGAIQLGEFCDLGFTFASELCVDCRVECPEGWQPSPSGTRCYSAVQPSTTWFQAQSSCAAMSVSGVRARLAVPRNQADLDAVAAIGGSEPLFVGAHDLETEGAFLWLDGTPIDVDGDFPQWSPGQPDNLDNRQDCLTVLLEQNGGRVDDRACDLLAASVCEITPGWAEDSVCGDGADDPGEECQEGETRCEQCNRTCESAGIEVSWNESPLGAHACYRTGGTAGDSPAARAFCEGNGDRLATPQDPGELSVVYILCDAGFGRRCWLGSNELIEGQYEWVSGEPFDYPPGAPPWGPSEPNGGATENCLMTILGDLHDYPCTATDPFAICEIPD